MAGANLVHVRVASGDFEFDAGAFWWTVSVIVFGGLQNGFAIALSVNLLHDGKVKAVLCYTLFFIHLGTRRVQFAGCTPQPEVPGCNSRRGISPC